MRLRSLAFAALGSAFILSAAAPAFADAHDWRGGRDQARDHHDWDHRRPDWNRGYYAPPVVVSPPVGYYAPPPVAYGPGISIGINIP